MGLYSKISRGYYSIIKGVKDKSPIILTVLSCAGVVATAVAAVKSTPKAKLRVAQARLQKGEELTSIEKAISVIPAYIPAISIGAGTILCTISASIISQKRQFGLTSAYILVENTFRTYRDKVKDIYGIEADRKITSEIAMDNFKQYYINEDDLMHKEVISKDVEVPLFYDPFSGRYFNRTYLDVQAAEYHLNRNLALRGYVSLNEFYSFLGLEGIPGGDEIGWGYDDFWEDGYAWMDFYHQKITTDDGLECNIINFMFDPAPLC